MPSIIEKLSEIRGEPFNYLSFLNLRGDTEDLRRDVKFAVQQLNSGEVSEFDISFAINSGAWRDQLVALVCIFASKKDAWFEQLKSSFLNHSFVAPQLAVAISLNHREDALGFFRECLSDKFRGDKLYSKQIGAAFALLPLVGQSDISMDGIEVDVSEFSIGSGVAVSHHRFWSDFNRDSEIAGFWNR